MSDYPKRDMPAGEMIICAQIAIDNAVTKSPGARGEDLQAAGTFALLAIAKSLDALATPRTADDDATDATSAYTALSRAREHLLAYLDEPTEHTKIDIVDADAALSFIDAALVSAGHLVAR